MKANRIILDRVNVRRRFPFISALLGVGLGIGLLVSGSYAQASPQQGEGSSAKQPVSCSVPNFAPAVNYNVQYAYSVDVGDFNGDNKPDLVTANSGSVSVLLGNGSGGFASPINKTVSMFPTDMGVGDFNHDGKLDVAVSDDHSSNSNVIILLGNGSGSFGAPSNFLIGATPTNITVAELNHDNYPDVIVSTLSSTIVVFLNNGSGGLGAGTHYTVGSYVLTSAVADFNGDTHADIAVVNQGRVSVLLGNGSGGFGTPTNLTGGASSLALGDLNGDGKEDIVAANLGSDQVRVWLGNGSGGFGAATAFPTGDAPEFVALADFNKDNILDVATANLNADNVTVLLGDGSGGLGAPTGFAAGDGPIKLVVGDFNRDGSPDLVTRNNTTGTDRLSVLINSCAGGGNPTATATPVQPTPTSTTPALPTATPTQCTVGQFSDVPSGSTFYPFVTCLVNHEIISGYADCTFRPQNNVTRGQLSKIVSNAAGFSDTPTGQQFEDVAVGSTFYNFVYQLASRSIVSGYACGGAGEPCGSGNKPYFRPNNPVSRAQTSKIVAIAKALPPPTPGQQTFQDVATNSTFWQWIEELSTAGAINGYACGGAGEPCGPGNKPYFRAANIVTRGQASKIVANTFFPNCSSK